MLLEVAKLDAFYGDLQALHGLDIEVDRGESVALVGANGAGKTTVMRCLAGLIEQKRGAITFGGNDIARMPAEAIARRGIALVPEGRMLFPSLNVEENLLMGALGRAPATGICSVSLRFFLCWRSAGGKCRTPCPAASKDWSPSAAR